MGSLSAEDTMIALFSPHLELNRKRIACLASVTSSMLLAGTSQLPQVARWLKQDTLQDSRIKYLERVLDLPYLTAERVYHPLLAHALQTFSERRWHLSIDRSTLGDRVDVLAVCLSFRKRAIPLVWEVMDFGCTGGQQQIRLLERALPLIPGDKQVVLHGDTEFGSVAVIQQMRQWQWNFILAQPGNTTFQTADGQRQLLSELPITPRRSIYLADIEWTEKHRLTGLNLFAFYAPHQNAPFAPRRERRYCVTSLPITHTLRRLGRRRWGIEPFFRDFKSSGWQIEASALTDHARLDRLLTLLSINYLWSTALGRWLCKTSRRREVDAHPNRHLSLFRLGYDWLIHQFRMDRPWPTMLSLYA